MPGTQQKKMFPEKDTSRQKPWESEEAAERQLRTLVDTEETLRNFWVGQILCHEMVFGKCHFNRSYYH